VLVGDEIAAVVDLKTIGVRRKPFLGQPLDLESATLALVAAGRRSKKHCIASRRFQLAR